MECMDPHTIENQNSTPQVDPSQMPQSPQSGTGVPASPVGVNPLFGQPKPKKHLMKWLIIVLVVLIVAVGVVLILRKPNTSSGSSTTGTQLSTQIKLLSQYGNKLTASDLSKFDKTSLFFAVMKQAAMQPVVSTTSESYEGADATDQTTRRYDFLHQSSFNYQNKQLALETQSPDGSFIERCVNGKNYTYDNVNTMSWQAETGPSGSCSDANSYVYDINDDFNTGGLNSTQAQTFIATISGVKGLVTVDSMQLVSHNNAPYIRLVASVHPVSQSDGTYEGLGNFMGSFKATGLDVLTWPYGIIGTLATGAKIIYYINPATQLPAYSQIGLTYYLSDTTGQQTKNSIYDFKDTVYSFGGQVQQLPLTGTPQGIKLPWTEESMQ